MWKRLIDNAILFSFKQIVRCDVMLCYTEKVHNFFFVQDTMSVAAKLRIIYLYYAQLYINSRKLNKCTYTLVFI